MMKAIAVATALMIAGAASGEALAQGANQNAPQPNSTGTGVYTPGTSPTGQAIDRPMRKGQSAPAIVGSGAGASRRAAAATRHHRKDQK